jgi:DoxX-like family
MQSVTQPASVSKISLWAGRIISALMILFLFFDGVTKVLRETHSVRGTMRLGYSEGFVPVIGTLLLVCVFFYAIPRTAVFGAVLLAGYLGGAVASQLRIGDPLSHVLFPIIAATLIWVGLYLSDNRLRALVPLQIQSATGDGSHVKNEKTRYL